jgi:hypothetical protein
MSITMSRMIDDTLRQLQAHTMLDKTQAGADDKIRAYSSLIAASATHRNHVRWASPKS